jgi:hypothetical protein
MTQMTLISVISAISVISGKVLSGLRQQYQQRHNPQRSPQQEIPGFFISSSGINVVHGEVLSL